MRLPRVTRRSRRSGVGDGDIPDIIMPSHAEG